MCSQSTTIFGPFFRTARKQQRIKIRFYFVHFKMHGPDRRSRDKAILEASLMKYCVNKKKSLLFFQTSVNCLFLLCFSRRISAPHIIRLLGVVSIDNPVYLLLEYMEKGDLRNYLHKHRPNQEVKRKSCISYLVINEVNFYESKFNCQNKKLCNDLLTDERFYKMAAEIADGMLWLSEHKYVHCDLAARNCLVSNNDVIKIAGLLFFFVR
jgi:serine/threonine protein kinase